MNAAPPLPHEAVYVRLGLSAIHGIGVFAIKPIPRGTNIFASDRVELVWIDRAALEVSALTPAERQLYHDFGVADGDRIGCPVDFNHLTPGWYLNEAPAGSAHNVAVDAQLNFTARCDIAEGDELTVRYTEFSDAPA